MTVVVIVGLGLVAASLGWLQYNYHTVRVDGASMQPALRAGDVVLLARRRPVQSGQIVVVEQPVRTEAGWHWLPPTRRRRRTGESYRPSVKRAVALPGQPVPPGLLDAVNAPPGTKVPNGSLLVCSDHAAVSIDSRHWGYLPIDRVLGVAVRSLGGESAGGRRTSDPMIPGPTRRR